MWPRPELEFFGFFLFGPLSSTVERVSERAAVVNGNCSFSSSTSETGKGTVDLAVFRFFEELLLASLDASMSAT